MNQQSGKKMKAWPADEEALNKGYLNRRAASLQLMWVWSCWCAIQAHSEERIV